MKYCLISVGNNDVRTSDIALKLREESGFLLISWECPSHFFFSFQEPLVLTTILSLFVKLHNVRVSTYKNHIGIS